MIDMTVSRPLFLSLLFLDRANFDDLADENEARALRVRGMGVRVVCAHY